MKTIKSTTGNRRCEREQSSSLLVICRAARRKTSEAMLIALLATVALFAVSCGGGSSKKQKVENTTETKTGTKAAAPKGSNTVKFISAEDDGGRGRVKIVLDKKVSLMTSDVTSSAGEVDMVQNSTGDGMNWLVTITGLTSPQEVTITIKNDKTNTFEPSSRKVTVTP